MKTKLSLLRRVIRETLLREYPEGVCPSCGADMKGKKFCKQCGTKLGVCPKCSETLDDNPKQKFCKKCGEKLAPPEGSSSASGDVVQKIQNMMDTAQAAWDATTKRNEASSALNAAHEKLFSAFNKMMRAYGEKGTEEEISAAKKEYAAAKDAVIAAAEEDEKTFVAWTAAMEKSGAPVPKEFLATQAELTASRKKSVDDSDASIEAMKDARAEFDKKMQKVNLEIKKSKGLMNMPPKPTDDYEKDVKAFKEFLDSNDAAQSGNEMYLAYVLGFLSTHDVDIASTASIWKLAMKRGHDFEEDGNDFSDEVLNDILDKMGGKAAAFKK